MKPRMFKTEAELVNFIRALPRPEGSAKVGTGELAGASAILTELEALAPLLMRYRTVLSKAQGGIHGNKNFDRFTDAASGNVLAEEIPKYEAALEALAEEVNQLINMGVSDTTAEQLRTAKTAIEGFKKMAAIIKGFQKKIQDRMANVEVEAKKMVATMEILSKKEKDATLKKAVAQVEEKIKGDLKEVQSLISACDRYCELQIAYNSIFLGAMAAA